MPPTTPAMNKGFLHHSSGAGTLGHAGQGEDRVRDALGTGATGADERRSRRKPRISSSKGPSFGSWTTGSGTRGPSQEPPMKAAARARKSEAGPAAINAQRKKPSAQRY